MGIMFTSIIDPLRTLLAFGVLVGVALAYGGYTTYQGPVYVRAGEDFSITCTTDVFRFPKWTLNGQSMEGGFALQLIRPKERGRQEAELRVMSAGLQHSGAYSCDPFDIDRHYVYVVDTERVNETQRCFVIEPGKSLALVCEPESKAPYFWFHGKENTRYLPKGHVEMRNSQLLFHGVQLSDAGRYTCRSVKDSSIEMVFHLVTPITSKQPKQWNKVGRLGSSVPLDCDFTADPQPHIEWFIGFDHAELKKRAHHRVHISMNPNTGVPNSRLIVQNVDPSDTNKYTCRASHLMCGLHIEQIISMRAQRLFIGLSSGEHSQRSHSSFVVRHHEIRAHKHRVHEQNFSSAVNSNSNPDHAISNGNNFFAKSGSLDQPQRDSASKGRRAANRQRDNIFLDRSKPKMVAAPGSNVTIRCVTPWLGMVNAWKKDDVVLSSGQKGVDMTSVRLRHEQVKELIENMEAIEAADTEKQLAKAKNVEISLAGQMAKVGQAIVGGGPDSKGKSTGEVSTENNEGANGTPESDEHESDGDQGQSQKQKRSQTLLSHSDIVKNQQRIPRADQRSRGSQRQSKRSRKPPSERLQAVLNDGQKLELWTLRIQNVSTADAGNYTCGGEALTYFDLRVEEHGEGSKDLIEPAGKTEAWLAMAKQGLLEA